MKLYNVKGNTYCYDTKFACMPVYMLGGGDVIMLDSGRFDGDANILHQIINEYKLNVKAVICTHAHIDHIGNNFWLQEMYGAEIIMPEEESLICSSIYNLKQFSNHPITRQTEKRYESMINKVDRKILKGDEYIDVCGVKFGIEPLYGHTSYHTGIVTPDNVLYAGDSILSKDVIEETKISYTSNLEEDIKTKYKLKNMNYDKYILAHKQVCDEIKSTVDENISFLEKQQELILESIEQPMTMSEIYRAVSMKLGIRQQITQYVLAEMMIKPYIENLINESLIKVDLKDGWLKYSKKSHSVI